MAAQQSRTLAKGIVIDAADRFVARRAAGRRRAPKPAVPAVVVTPDFDAGCWTPARLRRSCAPSVKLLPFVTLRVDGNPYAPAASYWDVAPSGKPRDDFKRGKQYAAMTIEASPEPVADQEAGGRRDS